MSAGELDLYFAYGSNMRSARLLARVPTVRAIGAAALRDFRLRWNKLGRDGSGKANVEAAHGEIVWGVLYDIGASDWSLLDRFEPGYERVRAEFLCRHTGVREGHFYLAPGFAGDLPVHDWYRDHMIAGAREHDLPSEHLRLLETLPVL